MLRHALSRLVRTTHGSQGTRIGSMRSRRWFIKRVLLFGVGALSLGGIGYSVKSNMLDVTRHQLLSPKAKEVGLTIAVISDFHAPRSYVTSDSLAASVNELDCDALFIVGDTIDRSENVKLVTGLFKQIHVRGPKLAVLGNWEHWAGVDLAELSEAYDEADVRLLINQTHTFEVGATRITVIGLDDLVGGYPNFELVKGKGEFQVILAHCPASFDRIRMLAEGPTLTLSGHTHGGQIAPLGFPLWLPRGSGHYVSGWYNAGSHNLFVTRGLGNSVVPLRIGSSPELSIIRV